MSPDGSYVVSTNAEGTLNVWDVTTRRVRRTLGVPAQAFEGSAERDAWLCRR